MNVITNSTSGNNEIYIILFSLTLVPRLVSGFDSPPPDTKLLSSVPTENRKKNYNQFWANIYIFLLLLYNFITDK